MKIILRLCLSFIIVGLLTPAYAKDDVKKKPHVTTFHIYADVNMRSIVKYNDGKNMAMKYVYPQLVSDTQDEYIDKFNTLVQDKVSQFTADFKKRIDDNKNNPLPADLQNTNNTLQVDYASSSIESGDSDYIVSVRFSVSGMIVGMAHPYHYHQVLNFNLDTGNQIELRDLFKPDADYLAILSNYTRGELDKRLSSKDMIADGTAAKEDNFNIWNIKPNGLLITFEEYQVAPYVEGSQTVLVPYDVIKPLLADDATINGCIAHHKRCQSSNVLTGGFIDEAAINTNKTYAMANEEPAAHHHFGETAHKLLAFPLSLIHRT